ncbi:hypothetical protein AB0001_004772 [Salmonella enterica]|nr:hypothetical protein [Salmonella enterica]EEP3373008.1 hypothetical protein [Salmonella enterica]EFP6579715.1 hypothetical protein [Salmonella enterica]EGC7970998.1 hypothetical protein [Salmonella enterica]EIV4461175.1 hypothetical protein [Salmonella enterica]
MAKQKLSVLIKNAMPEIMKKRLEGYTIKSIAEDMEINPLTFKHYFHKYKEEFGLLEPNVESGITPDNILHAKQIQGNETETINTHNDQSANFETILDANKRAGLNSKYLTQHRPLGKGKTK